jgi:periplasmic protein TonB
MFDSVLGRAPGAPGRPGTGTAVSLGLHGLGLALALYLSTGQHAPTPLPIRPIFFPAPPKPAPVAPDHPGGARPTPRPPPLTPRTEVALAPLPFSPPAATEGTVGAEARPEGGESCTAPSCGESGSASGDAVLEGVQASPPRLLSGPEPEYPAEAARAHVGGTLLVRCLVTAEGRVEDCRILRGLPFLEEPVLRALRARRYLPALSEGHAVPVHLVFRVQVLPP